MLDRYARFIRELEGRDLPYHNVARIYKLVGLFFTYEPMFQKEFQKEGLFNTAVVDAIVFHDFIIDHISRDSEMESIRAYRSEISIPDQNVIDAISSTSDFVPRGPVSKILHDLIWFNATDADLFRDNFEKLVREHESFGESETEYKRRLIALYRWLLDKPYFFWTDTFRFRFEEQARTVITNFLNEQCGGNETTYNNMRNSSHETVTKRVLLLFGGPSGSGKTYIAERLEELFPEYCHKLKQVTTRPMREGETEGNPYDFIDEAQYSNLFIEEKLIFTTSHNAYYGTLIPEKINTPFSIGIVDVNALTQLTDHSSNTYRVCNRKFDYVAAINFDYNPNSPENSARMKGREGRDNQFYTLFKKYATLNVRNDAEEYVDSMDFFRNTLWREFQKNNLLWRGSSFIMSFDDFVRRLDDKIHPKESEERQLKQ